MSYVDFVKSLLKTATTVGNKVPTAQPVVKSAPKPVNMPDSGPKGPLGAAIATGINRVRSNNAK